MNDYCTNCLFCSVSRHDLYNSESEESEIDSTPILPNIQFDIVEKDVEDDQVMEDDEPQEDFDFPLFSMGTVQEERGRSDTKQSTIRVTLRSPSPEIINQERPKSYYFAENDDLARGKFQQVAISGDDVIRYSKVIPYGPIGKVINLKEHNNKVERELQQANKKVRAGKKKRLAKIAANAHNKERAKIQKEIEAKAKAKLMKKIHHKRGGKKNKKKAGEQKSTSAPAKPKYRTE